MNAALDARADLVGLVFFPPSPRAVTPLGGADLAATARGRAMITALLVDADNTLIRDVMQRVNPDLLQLHGEETPKPRRGNPRLFRKAGDESDRRLKRGRSSRSARF